MDLLGKDKYKDFKTEIGRQAKSLAEVQKKLIESPMSKLRFTALDTIQKPAKVKLLVEGKNDALLLEYAYMSLTDGNIPYWSVNKAGRNEEIGSADEVRKTLEQSYAIWKSEPDTIIIGIFDHDMSGLKSYGELDYHSFNEIERGKYRMKKHKDGEIYAITLPVPGEMEVYLQKKQEFNFFELEHYMGLDYLSEQKVIRETSIPGVFEITGDKSPDELITALFTKFCLGK